MPCIPLFVHFTLDLLYPLIRNFPHFLKPQAMAWFHWLGSYLVYFQTISPVMGKQHIWRIPFEPWMLFTVYSLIAREEKKSAVMFKRRSSFPHPSSGILIYKQIKAELIWLKLGRESEPTQNLLLCLLSSVSQVWKTPESRHLCNSCILAFLCYSLKPRQPQNRMSCGCWGICPQPKNPERSKAI